VLPNDQINHLTVEQLKEAIDDYEFTIQTLQAFVSCITYDNDNKHRLQDSKYSFGRKMRTSTNNKIETNIDITPDAVIQLNNNLGYVVEIKKDLCRDQNLWEEELKQLLKYDDDKLKGWWTDDEMINSIYLSFLLHQSRSRSFIHYLDGMKSDNKYFFSNKFSIIEYSRDVRQKTFIFLRKEHGEISPQSLSERLNISVNVPIEDVLNNPDYGNKKYYDAKPPIEYTMNELWKLFTEKKGQNIFDEKTKSYLININVDLITEDIQKLFGSTGTSSRDVSFPKKDWVKEALDAFVSIKLASKIDNSNYIIRFKLLHYEDLIIHFYKHRKIKKAEKNTQLSLLQESN
jgi:hypothetical protein